MTHLNEYSVEHLQEMIRDTEETLTELKTEIERRQQLAQETEIEHLEEHLKRAVVSLGTIKEFLTLLLDEYREKQ